MPVAAKTAAAREELAVAVISGFHVDDYCLPAFRDAVKLLTDCLDGSRITDFSAIAPGDFVARVPPKIRSESASQSLKQIPVYQISAVGGDFDDEGELVHTGQQDHLYFEAGVCYLLDLNSGAPHFEESSDFRAGMVGCFEAREIGRVKEKYRGLDEDLRGILFGIPGERVTLSPTTSSG